MAKLHQKEHASTPVILICSATFFACLLALKVYVLKDIISQTGVLEAAGIIIGSLGGDVIFTFLTTIAIFAMAHFASLSARTVLYASAIVFSVFLILSIASANFLLVTGSLFSMAWLNYSEFSSAETLSAIKKFLEIKIFIILLSIVAIYNGLNITILRNVRGSVRYKAGEFAYALVLTAIFLYGYSFSNDAIPQVYQKNGIIYFTSTMVYDNSDSLISRLEESGPVRSPLDEGTHGSVEKAASTVSIARDAQVNKNIIFFVLESVPSKYVGVYGSKYGVTPNIDRYASQAIIFDNVYTHAPATNWSLVSLVNGIYPELSTQSMTAEYKEIPIPSVADVLKQLGYRTGFFYSSDSRFQSSDIFLRNEGFDLVADYRSRNCEDGIHRAGIEQSMDRQWAFLDFSDDECTVDSLTAWIAEKPDEPFLGIVWTAMTHYPYEPIGAQEKLADGVDLNNYLNLLKATDQAFEKMMSFLREKGLADNTIVVVLGDHGEAFGEHGTYIHAGGVYEENVHIPAMIVNSVLFSGERSGRIGGMSDFSPTTLDMLGVDAPAGWQGKSLLDDDDDRSVFFFAPWHGLQMGYREAGRKFIYRADEERMEIYNLENDPSEKSDLSASDPELAAAAKDKILNWVNVQKEQFGAIMDGTYPEKIMVVGTSAKVADANATQNTNAAAAQDDIRISISATGTSYLNPPKAEIIVDGNSIGVLEVKNAPNNSKGPIQEADIYDALSEYHFHAKREKCVRSLELKFLNDEWAGVDKSGDTDLLIFEIDIDNNRFFPENIYSTTEQTAIVVHEFGPKQIEYVALRTPVSAVKIDFPSDYCAK